MSLLTKDTNLLEEQRRLYLFDITMPSGMKCVKIGVASGSNSLDRMMQVNRSIYQQYRYTACIGIKRDRPVEAKIVFKYETMLHRFFSEYQYKPKKKFDGCTELFAISLVGAVEVYEYLLDNGLGSLDEFSYDPNIYEVEPDNLPF